MTATEPEPITWDLSAVMASTEGQAAGYTLGWQHGYAEGYVDAQEDAQARRTGAEVARAGVEAVDTVNARRKADERARQIAAGWSS